MKTRSYDALWGKRGRWADRPVGGGITTCMYLQRSRFEKISMHEMPKICITVLMISSSLRHSSTLQS